MSYNSISLRLSLRLCEMERLFDDAKCGQIFIAIMNLRQKVEHQILELAKAFSKCDALRHELSWTHYRLLTRQESLEAREWYMQEAASQNWSTRVLERQMSSLYYKRLLSSKDNCRSIQPGNPKRFGYILDIL